MAIAYKAAVAFEYFGVAYAAGDTIDTTGWGPEDITRLFTHRPVYAAEAGGSISAASGNFRITTATVPTASWTVLSLGTPNGDAVLDLTDPANPIATVAGLYTVTASIKHTGDDITHNMFLEIDLDNNGEDGFTVAAVPMVNDGNGTVHGTCTYYVPLGGVINIACQQSSGSSVTLSTTQSRVVVSVIPCDRATLPN